MSELLSEQTGHVLTLTINRPERKNALTYELGFEIAQTIREAARDDSVWVIALTGTGNFFCPGLDLANRGKGKSTLSPQDDALDQLSHIGHLFQSIRMICDKPIVAGINGTAAGGGTSIAMSADARIMKRSAKIVAGYLRSAGSPDVGLSWSLLQLVNYEQALRFFYENRTLTAEQALKEGFVGEVVDDDKFDDRLQEYCQELAKWPPITMRSIKRVIGKAIEHRDMEQHLIFERATILKSFDSEDGKEAQKAFLEKRKPVVKGL